MLVPYPLLTPRLSIEPLGRHDIDAFAAYRQDPEVARYQSWEPSYSTADATRLVESQAGVTLPVPGEWLQLGVRARDTGALVGDVAVHTREDANATFELGFTVAREHQGNGFGREAVGRAIEFLFDEVGAVRILASCDRRNTASQRLLSALGFEPQPDRSWTEEFKNEWIEMDEFELSLTTFQKSGQLT